MDSDDHDPLFSLDVIYSWKDVAADVRHRAILNGICARTIPVDGRRTFYALPVTVFPSKVDSRCFYLAQKLQKLNNKIIHKIANDHEFLEKHLKGSLDEFIKKLYEIYINSREKGFQAKHQVGIFRTDYMINISKRLKQVETNTIAVGFGGISTQVRDLHCYTFTNYSHSHLLPYLPANDSCNLIAQTLVNAHHLYGSIDAGILVVIQQDEANSMDQKLIEWQIRGHLNVEIYRRTFEELGQARDLTTKPDQTLELKVYNHSQGTILGVEIAVVYYRTGYRTDDYSYERSFEIRQRIENSKAIKCPSIQYQLAGLKCFQMLLTDRKIFDKFIDDNEMDLADELFSTFSKFYKITKKSRQMVEADPKGYVLKSNQEGGGNNVFGEAIVEKLDELSDTECRDLFLMEFIKQESYFVEFVVEKESTDDEQLKEFELVDELGIYGLIIGEYGDEINSNEMGGHLLRSKPVDSNEAGIMSGAGILNSPFVDYRADQIREYCLMDTQYD